MLVAGTNEVWTRDLSDGGKAVALFNRGTQDAVVSATYAQLGVTGTPVVRDLWNRTNLTASGNGVSVNVPFNAAVLLTLRPAVAGADAGAGDAADASGGAVDAGGPAGVGGASGPAGTGGTPGAGGAAGPTDGLGGAVGGGAGGASAGAGGAGTAGGSGGSGCGCAVGDGPAAPWRLGAPALVLLLAALARRGGRRRAPTGRRARR